MVNTSGCDSLCICEGVSRADSHQGQSWVIGYKCFQVYMIELLLKVVAPIEMSTSGLEELPLASTTASTSLPLSGVSDCAVSLVVEGLRCGQSIGGLLGIIKMFLIGLW